LNNNLEGYVNEDDEELKKEEEANNTDSNGS